MKYRVRGCVLLTHWMLEFMKQVFPRLLKPVAPFSVGTGKSERGELVRAHLAMRQGLRKGGEPTEGNGTRIGHTSATG